MSKKDRSDILALKVNAINQFDDNPNKDSFEIVKLLSSFKIIKLNNNTWKNCILDIPLSLSDYFKLNFKIQKSFCNHISIGVCTKNSYK